MLSSYQMTLFTKRSFDPHIDAPAYQGAGVDMNVTFLMAVDAMDMTNGELCSVSETYSKLTCCIPMQAAWKSSRARTK